MGPTRCRAALADLDDANGPRAAWSSPGAPHRGGGLLASEPGLVTGTHDLRTTIKGSVGACPPVGPRVSRSETPTVARGARPDRPVRLRRAATCPTGQSCCACDA